MQHLTKLNFTSIFIAVFVIFTSSIFSQKQTSIIDYLKARGKNSTLTYRVGLYHKYFPQERGSYRGTAQQNLKLLNRLLHEDTEAGKIASHVEYKAKKASKKYQTNSKFQSRTIQKSFQIRRWIPAEGFGIHGSYGVAIYVRLCQKSKHGLRIVNGGVSVCSAASHLGSLDFSGTYEIRCKGRSVKKGLLTIPEQTYLHERGSVIKNIEANTINGSGKIEMIVVITPCVKTDNGYVSLWKSTHILRLRAE